MKRYHHPCTCASAHGADEWTSFGISSPDQPDLFCFLNTYRCSKRILLLLRLPPSVRPPLFTHIYYLSFPTGWTARCKRAPSRVVILTAAPQAYILLLHTRPHMRIYVLLIYICIHTIIYYSAYIYICEHIATRAHTYTYTVSLYVYSYIYTQLHIYYIIVLYIC